MTTKWGPSYWFIIHQFAFGYALDPSDTDKAHARDFYNGIPTNLPCAVCAKHFTDILNDDPVEYHLSNRTDLIEWTWIIHNTVNQQLGKPLFSLDAFCKKYGIGSDGDPGVVSTTIGGITQTIYRMVHRS